MATFHEGEFAVQERAGVRAQAARLAGMLAPPDLDGGAHRFLAGQRFAAIAVRDRDGTFWTSALVGPAGFLDGHGTGVDVAARPRPGDPLADLVAGGPIGMVAIDFAARRRIRVNGTIASVSADGFRIAADQAFGNCPKYIHPRILEPGAAGPRSERAGHDGRGLTDEQLRIVTSADTFFLGTVHPERGADASHRGGPAGFVHVADGRLWWADLPGNNLFNSFGNLAVDATASLLFVEFATGATLHLSGTAAVEWDVPDEPGGTGRRVWFTPQRVVEPGTPLAV